MLKTLILLKAGENHHDDGTQLRSNNTMFRIQKAGIQHATSSTSIKIKL